MKTFEGRLVVPFEELRMTDVEVVGGKNASLGEMISQLAQAGVKVPGGFATTAHAFRAFLTHNRLTERIAERLVRLNIEDVKALAQAGAQIRSWVREASFPTQFEKAIRQSFQELMVTSSGDISFAVRSSATAEDLPDASFAGQQETVLNVVGIEAILKHILEVFASLYNDRAISYRVHKGFAHEGVALSAGIQRMCRSDLGAAGVMFTLDTESGFRDVVFITSAYGLGETVVQGAVNPDEFYVHKPMLQAGKHPIVRRQLGSKLLKMQYADRVAAARDGTDGAGKANRKTVQTVDTPVDQRARFSLSDPDIIELARYAMIIEAHYGRPMDIEWGKDGQDGQIFILQARPETVKSQSREGRQQKFALKGTSDVLASGRAIGQRIGAGPVRVVGDSSEMDRVQAGDVLVTDMTDPNWEPVMKRASAIVTNRGGRTCHAAIIARELGIPAVVGCGDATDRLGEGNLVTVSCAQGDTGYVYDGMLETEVTEVENGVMPTVPVKVMMNIGNPQLAFEFSSLPNDGVGLARVEFIINNNIGIHPKAILDYPAVDADLKKAVESVARGYASPRAFYVEKLSEGVATIAAAFWPKPVIVRLSDFKSNEYRKLIGGARYEPDEENPMLGFRGASRYLAPSFSECFELECKAMKRVREVMGLTNVELMVPFVRTTQEAAQVVRLMQQHGLRRGDGANADGQGGLKLIMMCELPSNAILAEKFLEHFDGFSIGSNDLTQLTLGLDRDSGLVAAGFDERDPAVMALIERAISACKAQAKYVGICGQGPSDHPELAQWLMDRGISSISLNPDTVVPTWQRLGGQG